MAEPRCLFFLLEKGGRGGGGWVGWVVLGSEVVKAVSKRKTIEIHSSR